MKNNYDIIAIMGKAGSGKDTLCRTLLKQPEFADAVPIISCTTRPIRDNETNGVNYYFLTIEEFTDQVLSGDIIEATSFNNWWYGTSSKNLNPNKLNIGVFNPEAIGLLRENEFINLKLIYVEADDKDRLLRQLNREYDPDCHEIVRRFSADEQDFAEDIIDFLAPDLFILNNNGADINRIASTIAKAWLQGQF